MMNEDGKDLTYLVNLNPFEGGKEGYIKYKRIDFSVVDWDKSKFELTF